MPEENPAAPTTAAVPERNWAGNLTYRAAHLHRPRSVAEVQEIVAGSPHVKALGSRHCFNDIADTTADLVSLEALDTGVEFQTAPGGDGGIVWVPGGMKYGDLVLELAPRGYALHNLASLPHITVVGATATGTHGSGNRNGSLSTSVAGLEIVRSDGGLATLDADHPDLPGAVVHLGALGIVTRIALRFQRTFSLRNNVYLGLTWERLLDELDAVADAAYSVSVFTNWHEITMVWVKARTDEPERRRGGVLRRALGHRAHPHDQHGRRREPHRPARGPGEWHERLPHFRAGFTPSKGEELQTEYFVPRRHARAACDRLRALADAMAPLLLTCELRTVAGDDLWLSPASGGDVLALHFTWVRDEGRVRALLPEIEAALRPFGARPHWGKVFTIDGGELEELYPRLPDFRDLVRRFDPRGAFTNAYLDRTIAAFG